MTYLTTSLASLASAKAIRLRDDDGGGGDDDDGEREERRKTVPSNDVDLSNALNSSPPPLQPLPPTRLLVPCLSPHTANRPPLDLFHFRSLSFYLSLCSNIPNRGEERRLPFVYSRRKQNNICAFVADEMEGDYGFAKVLRCFPHQIGGKCSVHR